MAEILDGKSLAATIHGEQANLVQSLSQKAGRPPGLAVILVGDDPASHTYVANKRKAYQKFGIYAPDSIFLQRPLLRPSWKRSTASTRIRRSTAFAPNSPFLPTWQRKSPS